MRKRVVSCLFIVPRKRLQRRPEKVLHYDQRKELITYTLEPYANVINLLGGSQDLETMVNAFTLLNALLMTCPSEAKAVKLGKKWEKLGLHDKLRVIFFYLENSLSFAP